MEAKKSGGDRALDALLFLMLIEDVAPDVPIPAGPAPELEPADQRALDALGPDLVQRILDEDGT